MSIKPAILIVDDNEDIRTMLRLFLVRKGFDVAEACNGEEALDILKRTSVSIIVSDFHMPVMDGLTLGSRLSDARSTIPFILMSADSSASTRLENSSFQTAFIQKPFAMHDLGTLINTMLTESALAADDARDISA